MKGKKTKSIGALILSLIFALVVSIFPMMSALALEGDVEINETNFPDAIFREYVESFDTDETKGVLSQAERDEVTRISVKNKGISDLKGVEFFTNLTELICNENSLTNLDVSKNTKLSYLSCGYNSLTELDVSANTALNALYCNDNQLTGLDMSNNLNLQNLNCNFNKITNLDVTQNTALESLLCRVNELDSLDVSKNLALTDLDCGSNNLTNLNVTENTDLTTLSCYKNQLTELDVTQNTALTLLDCSHNILSTLDVTQNTALKTLNCANTALSTLDVSQNPALERLECYSNQLTELDVRQNPALKSLRCMTNKLTVLDVSQNPALEKLECYNNQLTSLDVSANSNLDTFDARFQEYNIEVDPDILSFNLSSLPGNFNPERAHNLVGATVSGTTLIVDSTKPAKITYNYNAVDNDKTFDVTLNVTYIGTGTGKVTVSFDANGGTGTMESEIINKGSNYTLPENTFTAPAGQEFNYWEVNGTKKAVGDVITVNEATTVKAVWAEQVTVSFDANGGTGTMESEIINKGSNYTLPESTFTAPAGKEFYYWEVNGIEKAVGDVITVNEDTTVKAMWNNFVEINEINFPDANFRAYVESDIDRNNDGRLSTEERDRINIIIVSDKDISDLKGIEFFTKLEQLHCYNNKLTNIDISQNTALTILNCDNNQLTNLDVRQNTALTLLGCYNNQLTNLDVSQNTALTVLECQNNQLTNLDVSQNPDLKTLKCNNNQLTSLDVSANANLTTFDARLQKYNIEVDENTLTFDLSSLPGDFNLARAHDWSRATVSGTTLTADSDKPAQITYKYDAVDNGKTFLVILNVTYKAMEKVTVSFDANGGTGTMDDATVNKGSNYTLPENTFTAPEGKEFESWSVDGQSKAAGDVITVNENTTVKAVWADKPFEQVIITFNANGGTGTMENVSVNKGDTYILPESTFTAPNGQTFKAWLVGDAEKAAGDVITVNEDTNITAVWKDEEVIPPVDPEEPTDPETPVEPEEPTDPETPVDPEEPTDPETPVDPEEPTDPETPVDPEEPTDPETPVDPEEPTDPETPVDPEEPTEPEKPVVPNKPQTKPDKPNAKTGINNMFSLASASTLLVTIGGTLFISKNRRKKNQ